jgi:hypothetical protein
MDFADDDGRLGAVHRTLNLVWGAMVGGVVVFAGVCFFLLRSGSVRPQPDPDSHLALILVTAGFAALVAAPFVGRALTLWTAPTRGGGEELERALGAYRSAVVVASGLREAAGLLGGLTVLLTGQLVAGLALAGAAVVMLVRGRPQREHLEALARSAP